MIIFNSYKTGYFSTIRQMLVDGKSRISPEVNIYLGEKQEKSNEKPKTAIKNLAMSFLYLISMANSLRDSD